MNTLQRRESDKQQQAQKNVNLKQTAGAAISIESRKSNSETKTEGSTGAIADILLHQ